MNERDKVSLHGAYRDDNGKQVLLGCVRKIEKRFAGNQFMEYLSIF